MENKHAIMIPVFVNEKLMKTEKKQSKSTKIGIGNYFKEVISEAKKVSWPTRKQTITLTIVVVVISVIVSLSMTLIDYLFNRMVLGI